MEIKSVITSKVSTSEANSFQVFVLDNDIEFFKRTRDLITSILSKSSTVNNALTIEFRHFTSPKDCMLALSSKPTLLIFEFFFNDQVDYSDGGKFMDEVLEKFPEQELLMTSDRIDSDVLMLQLNRGLSNYIQKGANVDFRIASFMNEVFAA